MDYFNISSELAKAKEPAFKSGMLRRYAKGSMVTDPPKKGLSAYDPLLMPKNPYRPAASSSISPEQQMRQNISNEVNRRAVTTENTRTTPKFISKEERDAAIPQESLPLKAADIATDIMQLGNFIPLPQTQAIGKIGNVLGATIDGIQIGEELYRGSNTNYGNLAVNALGIALPKYFNNAGYTRDMYNTIPGSMADKIANYGNRAGSYRHLTAYPQLRNNPVIRQGISSNRKALGLLGTETAIDSYAKGGFTGRSEYKRSIENDIRVGMYADGGPIRPIYTSNPNDPRLRAYNDSLTLYKKGESDFSLYNQFIARNNIASNRTRTWDNPFAYDTINDDIQPIRGYGFYYNHNPDVFSGTNIPSNSFPANTFRYDKPKNKVVFANPKIVAKQKQLKEAGLYSGELDGIWGPKSEEAWKKYEEASKPKPAPVVNKPTTTPAPRAEIVKDERYYLPRNQAPVLPSGKMNPQVYRGSGNTAGIETDASGNPIMANGGLKKYAKGALTTDPPKTGLSAYNPLFMPPKPKITNSPAPISSEEKMRQAISGEVNRRTATTESTRTQPKLVSQEQKQYAKENNEESLRQKRLADAAAAEKEEMTLGNWPELLARRSQATADKLDIPFIPNVIDPAYMLGSMASGLGAVPYNIEQGNYGQAAWSLAEPILAGGLAGIGAKSSGQFANNLFNPLAGAKLPSKNKVSTEITNATNNLSREELIRNLQETIDKNALVNDFRNRIMNPSISDNMLTYPQITHSESMRLQRELYNRDWTNLNSTLAPLSDKELARYLSTENNLFNQISPSEYSVWPKPKSTVNRSGLTKDEVLASNTVKDKNAVQDLSETEFENTVLKPTGELVSYKPGTELSKMTYNLNTKRLQLDDAIPMRLDDYVAEFNSNIETLNDIIAKRNKSGLQYKAKKLEAFDSGYGRLTFENPSQTLREADMDFHIPEGSVSWGVDLNPGKWTGAVEDIPNTEYFRSIPGIEMSNTTSGVFADRIPRKGTGTYEAINEYLKTLNLGRVKPGFNSQTGYSRGAWENFVKSNRAHGFYGNPGTIYGAMKTLIPVGTTIGLGTAATQEYEKGGLIKRADGSYSRRGLWDNIRANRGSGKKPTKQMLEQEKKIKAKTKYEKGGKNPIVLANNDYDLTQAPKEGNYLMPDVNRPYYVDAQGNERSEYRMGVNLDGKETLIPTVVNGKQLTQEQAVQRYYQTGLHMGQFNSPKEAEYASQLRTKKYNVLKDAVRSSPELEKFSKGGYRVSRTSERKGKTHKVTGPDGSVKYFGDPSMGERSKSKYGKDAFYKRHAKSLKKNPHFRAYAKATWSDGGLVSESDLFNLSSY